ncbi:hypothetical protein CP979_17015 [Streptomyces filamentosus]|nr:hypothetical protein CP979_17015 [Streptomyces filamentosus]
MPEGSGRFLLSGKPEEADRRIRAFLPADGRLPAGGGDRTRAISWGTGGPGDVLAPLFRAPVRG